MGELKAPFRFRELESGAKLLVNEVGDFGFFNGDVLNSLYGGNLSDMEKEKLKKMLVLYDGEDDWRLTALAARVRKRIQKRAKSLSYMLIIPTLRCDLDCGYCQVSRASPSAKGYDFDATNLDALETFWGNHCGTDIKIEFQGGEPTLRLDLIKQIIKRAENHFQKVEFALCTNLMSLSPELEEVIADPRVHISTSIDGPANLMAANRTGSIKSAEMFFENLSNVIKKYGSDKVSALPTIPESAFSKIGEIIDFYRELGLRSIFLRPVNYLGFARKNHASSLDATSRWNEAYLVALDKIMEINKTEYFEEFYASMVFQKILGVERLNYVDFRSPNRFFEDYCVVDYDGSIYPTDEARMLSRTKQIDLKIGALGEAIDNEKLSSLNFSAMNEVHPDCIHCAYGPFCGVDLIDDLSRYGRIDLPKEETAFCKRNMFLFDLLFSKIESRDRSWLDPLMSWAFRKTGAHAPYEALYD